MVTMDDQPGCQLAERTSNSSTELAFLFQPPLHHPGDGAGWGHIAIGGFIRRRAERFVGRARAPPHSVSGRAFGSKSHSNARTELVIFLTPRVIYDTTQVQDATDEIRSKLKKIQGMIKDNQ